MDAPIIANKGERIGICHRLSQLHNERLKNKKRPKAYDYETNCPIMKTLLMRLRPAHPALIALVAVLAPRAVAQAAPSDINPAARSSAMAAALPGFDVASIRQNKSTSEDSFLDTTDGGVVIENASFAEIVEFAYNIASFDLITGISGPVGSTHFDIHAKIAAADSSPAKFTGEQLRAMLIPLLADRFHLRVRVLAKKMTVYEMVVAKGGPRFKLDEPDASSLTAQWGKGNILIFKRSSMSTLAGVLSDSGLHRLVVDRTGLAGAGDFTLKWSSDVAQEQGDPNLVSIFTAMQDQLGLKLKPVKLPVDTLAVDNVEMPSEN